MLPKSPFYYVDIFAFDREWYHNFFDTEFFHLLKNFILYSFEAQYIFCIYPRNDF